MINGSPSIEARFFVEGIVAARMSELRIGPTVAPPAPTASSSGRRVDERCIGVPQAVATEEARYAVVRVRILRQGRHWRSQPGPRCRTGCSRWPRRKYGMQRAVERWAKSSCFRW